MNICESLASGRCGVLPISFAKMFSYTFFPVFDALFQTFGQSQSLGPKLPAASCGTPGRRGVLLGLRESARRSQSKARCRRRRRAGRLVGPWWPLREPFLTIFVLDLVDDG